MTNRRPESDAPSTDESLLHRWSRRKQAAREGDAASDSAGEPPAPPQSDDEQADATIAEAHDADAADTAPPTDEDMPPVESLDAESDYSQFMSPRVSDSLRRMALRKLFGMSSFNIRDGLDDYDVHALSIARRHGNRRQARGPARRGRRACGGGGTRGAVRCDARGVRARIRL